MDTFQTTTTTTDQDNIRDNDDNSNNQYASEMIPRLSQLPTHIWTALASGDIQSALHQALRPVLWDMILLVLVGSTLVPLARVVYNVRHPPDLRDSLQRSDASKDLQRASSSSINDKDKDDDDPDAPRNKYEEDPFYQSISFLVAHNINQLLQLMILVYMFDAILIATETLGYDIWHETYKSATFCQIVYTMWLAVRVRSWKRYWIALAVRRPMDRLGKALLWDRLLDVILLVSVLITLMGLLHMDVGPGLTSIFAFGGVGTLIFSLASKDLASQIVTAMVLSTSDKFHVGEAVQFGDGTSGVVTRLGWLNTDIRGYDNITTRIPNASLANLRCSNISREKMSRVVVTLRFSHEDIDKLPELMQDIKTEIAASCPKLIQDGSRPFRVLWQDMLVDCVLVTVTSHFNLKPATGPYYENKQEVLFAIHRAVKQNDMHYVLPTYSVASLTPNLKRAPPVIPPSEDLASASAS